MEIYTLRHHTSHFFVVYLLLPHGMSVMYERSSNGSNILENCWQSQPPFEGLESLAEQLGQCVKHKMYQNLAENLEGQCMDVGDGVSYYSTQGNSISPRDIFPLGEEPSSFRELMDAYSNYLSRRGLRWDLGHLYPGLVMTIDPTISSEGVLSFNAESLDPFTRANLGPGHHLIQRILLPRLLGFRMNVMALLPLMFGILIYAAKNAVIFSKITLIISTLLALKSLFVLQHLRPPQASFHDNVDSSAAASNHQLIGGPRPHSIHPDMVFQMFSNAIPPFRGVNDKYPATSDRGVRNFSWERVKSPYTYL